MYKSNEQLIARAQAIAVLPDPAISMMRSVVNQQLEKGNSEATAMKVGWEVVKSRFERVENQWVARTDAFVTTEYYTFKTEPALSFVTRTEDGTTVHNYVLSDIWPDKFGTSPTEELMQEWAKTINEEQPEADVDHELFEKAQQVYGPNEIQKVQNLLKSKKGIAKAIRATVSEGKLLVSLAFDKRYAKYVDKVRGLSIEAAAITDQLTKKFKSGKLLGFTLAVNKDPVNPRSKRIN